MSRSEKWQLWDHLFGWQLKWKKPWLPIHGIYYPKNMHCSIDDPDMPF